MGTGDITHPGWLTEVKEKCVDAGNGLLKLKDAYMLPESRALSGAHFKPVYFMLTAEVSCIYKRKGKVRKNHTILVLPDFDTAERLQSALAKIGNITSDGRPILGLDDKHLLDLTMNLSPTSYLIPAHIWTPWFSMLGSKSGFDSLEDCYEDLSDEIFAVETGLSSDPPMNRQCRFLDTVRLVSNSDAHSLEKLGREANLFDTSLDYLSIRRSLKEDDGFLGTIEFYPEEGKYYLDGHRNCHIAWHPKTTDLNNGLCTVCRKPVTKGVLYRINELSDRADPSDFKSKQTHSSIIPLPELLAEILGVKSPKSKKVQELYFDLIKKMGAEFYLLLFKSISEIKKEAFPEIAESIKRMRAGKIDITEGYDGEYGVIKVLTPPAVAQASFDF